MCFSGDYTLVETGLLKVEYKLCDKYCQWNPQNLWKEECMQGLYTSIIQKLTDKTNFQQTWKKMYLKWKLHKCLKNRKTNVSPAFKWDDPEGWYREGGGSRVQDEEHMYTCGRFILIFGKTNTIM